jgi:hypothetical protein
MGPLEQSGCEPDCKGETGFAYLLGHLIDIYNLSDELNYLDVFSEAARIKAYWVDGELKIPIPDKNLVDMFDLLTLPFPTVDKEKDRYVIR